MDKTSYAMGMNIALNLLQAGVKDLEFNDFLSGLKAVMTGAEPELANEEAGRILDRYFSDLENAQAEKQAEIGTAMLAEGEAFLAANATVDGVVTLPSGLQYKVLREGHGRSPKRSDKVRCHYEGTFVNGMKFDSSFDRGEPAVFGVTQVIKGWTEALQLMKEGSLWEIYIPYDLAYGETGAQGAIPPFAALIFKVELLEVL